MDSRLSTLDALLPLKKRFSAGVFFLLVASNLEPSSRSGRLKNTVHRVILSGAGLGIDGCELSQEKTSDRRQGEYVEDAV